MRTAIIVFIKNPEPGKVKTRLAKTVGNENALRVYRKLLKHTADVLIKIDADIHVFYSSWIDQSLFEPNHEPHLQEGADLGVRMFNAFNELKTLKYDKIIIVGSDCYQLSSAHVDKAVSELSKKDVVVGPAFDRVLFFDKLWSTETVFSDTLTDIENLQLSFSELEMLSDVDHEEDLGELKEILV